MTMHRLFSLTYFPLYIYLYIFQALTILAFNDRHFNAKMLREVLSVGPTFVVMKFFESKFLFMQNMLWVICFVSPLKMYITSVGESDKCT